MINVTVEEIANNIFPWLEKAERGEKIFITRYNIPIAEIIPVPKQNKSKRPIGLCKGEFEVPDDFNAPLPEEILRQFEGK